MKKRILSALLVLLLIAALLPAFSGPAAALDQNAPAISVNKQYTGSLASSGSENWYKFTLSKAGYVWLTFGHEYVDSSRTYWQTYLYTASNSEMVGWNWEGNATVDNETSRIGLPAGTYYLRINDYNYSSAAYHFKVNFTASTVWEKEYNDTIVTANTIPVNTQISGSIMKDGDPDWYGFTLPKDGYVWLTFGHEYVDSSRTYWQTYLYTASNSEMVGWSWEGNATVDNETGRIGLPAGTYYLRINDYNYSSAAYHFKVNFTASTVWEKEYNDTIVTANTIPVNTQISGSIMKGGDPDWYGFTLPTDDTVTLSFSHPFIDSSGTYWITSIYTASNSEIKSWNNAGNATDSSVTIPLSAGTYYLKVTDFKYSAETYSFRIGTTVLPPAGLKATAAAGKNTVTWSAVDGATRYRMYRSVYSGTAWGDWVLVDSNVTGTSWTDTDVTGGTKYMYRMRAYVDGTWSGYSNSVSVTGVAPVVTVPTVKAAASAGKNTVTWSAVNGATRYRMYKRVHTGSHWEDWVLVSANVKGTSWVDTDVTGGTTYMYRMRAYIDGGWYGYSNNATVTAAAPAVTVPTVSAAASAGRNTVIWDAVDGATRYRMYRRVYSGSAWGDWELLDTNVKGASWTDVNVASGTKYMYRMRAYIDGSWYGYSNSAAVTAK